MFFVYQILEIVKKEEDRFDVVLQQVTRPEVIEGTITIIKIKDFELMSFCKSGQDRGHIVVGKFSEHDRMTFFHSGDTQFVFVDDKKLNYIDVIEVMSIPFDGELRKGDLLIISS